MISGGKKNVENPWLSIVTPVKNGAKTLERTIDSVNELGEGVEYIIIDADSRDGTKELLQKREQDISLFISEPDKGIYQAMNKGIKHCKGSLIGIISSNDWYNHQNNPFAAKLKQLHLEKSESVIYGSLAFFEGPNYQYSYGASPEELVRGMIPHPSIFVPRKNYEKFGYYDEHYQIASDYEWFLRYKLQGGTFLFLNGILANFSLGGVSYTEKCQKETQEIKKKYGLIQEEQVFLLRRILMRVYFKVTRTIERIFEIKR